MDQNNLKINKKLVYSNINDLISQNIFSKDAQINFKTNRVLPYESKLNNNFRFFNSAYLSQKEITNANLVNDFNNFNLHQGSIIKTYKDFVTNNKKYLLTFGFKEDISFLKKDIKLTKKDTRGTLVFSSTKKYDIVSNYSYNLKQYNQTMLARHQICLLFYKYFFFLISELKSSSREDLIQDIYFGSRGNLINFLNSLVLSKYMDLKLFNQLYKSYNYKDLFRKLSWKKRKIVKTSNRTAHFFYIKKRLPVLKFYKSLYGSFYGYSDLFFSKRIDNHQIIVNLILPLYKYKTFSKYSNWPAFFNVQKIFYKWFDRKNNLNYRFFSRFNYFNTLNYWSLKLNKKTSSVNATLCKDVIKISQVRDYNLQKTLRLFFNLLKFQNKNIFYKKYSYLVWSMSWYNFYTWFQTKYLSYIYNKNTINLSKINSHYLTVGLQNRHKININNFNNVILFLLKNKYYLMSDYSISKKLDKKFKLLLLLKLFDYLKSLSYTSKLNDPLVFIIIHKYLNTLILDLKLTKELNSNLLLDISLVKIFNIFKVVKTLNYFETNSVTCSNKKYLKLFLLLKLHKNI